MNRTSHRRTSDPHPAGRRDPKPTLRAVPDVVGASTDVGLDHSWTTLQTRHPAKARELMTRRFPGSDVAMTGGSRRFEFSVRSRHLALFGVDLVRHTGHLEMTGSPGDHVHVVEVLRGALEVRARGSTWPVPTGGAVMTTGDDVAELTWDDVQLVVVRLNRFELRRVAAELSGTEPAGVQFQLSRAASEAHARHWSAVVRYVVQGMLDNPVFAMSPFRQRETFRLLAGAALESFPQTGISLGAGFEDGLSTVPATVRRAIEFIEANARRPITVEDVARAARLSVRGTQAAFHRHLGTSPAAYLRQVRLAGAHRELMAADPTTGTSVADIAARWGFLHLGHFAASYRECFGVQPSHTLAH